MKHEDIVQLIANRVGSRDRRAVTDEDVERWVSHENFERDNAFNMTNISNTMDSLTTEVVSPPLGSLDTEPAEGVFRGIMIQLNSMSTSRVQNPKSSYDTVVSQEV